MRPGSNTAGCHVDLARVALGIGDKLGNRSCRYRWIDNHCIWHVDNTCYRHYVVNEVGIELVKKCGVDGGCHVDDEQRIAVSGRTHNCFSADVGSAPRAVLDNELLPKPLR